MPYQRLNHNVYVRINILSKKSPSLGVLDLKVQETIGVTFLQNTMANAYCIIFHENFEWLSFFWLRTGIFPVS